MSCWRSQLLPLLNFSENGLINKEDKMPKLLKALQTIPYVALTTSLKYFKSNLQHLFVVLVYKLWFVWLFNKNFLGTLLYKLILYWSRSATVSHWRPVIKAKSPKKLHQQRGTANSCSWTNENVWPFLQVAPLKPIWGLRGPNKEKKCFSFCLSYS